MDQQGQSIDSANSYVIEMFPLANELSGKLDALNSSQAPVGDGRSSCPIVVAKVRYHTRNVDCGEYDPDHVAIGPYNYPRPQSKSPQLAMEYGKLTSLDMVLSAAKATTPSMTVNVYVNELACLEQSVRNCYANPFDDMTSEQFVRMLLLDGCYILSRLVGFRAQPADDPPETVDVRVPLAERAEALAVVRDVFYLAENQIPFFVLEKIGELTAVDGKDRVIKEITEYALDLLRGQKYAGEALALVPPQPTVPGNLLHLLHMHLKPALPSAPPAATDSDLDPVCRIRRWRSATEYSFAGVKFKGRSMDEKGMRCILDVKLNGGGATLEVPRLDIDNETWRLLRNLMELEQRNGEAVGTHVTAYCVFMSEVACTPKDVELLWEKGIIVHGKYGNNDEVAKWFADLCKGIQFDLNDPSCNYLRDTCLKLEKRAQSYWRSSSRRWMAWLRREYFSSPWLAVGLLAAAIGLVCTVVQAVYSALSYKHGGN